MAKEIDASDIIKEMGDIAFRHVPFIASISLAITAVQVLVDSISLMAGNLLGIVVTIFVQYIFLEQVFAERLDPEFSPLGRRYGAMFSSTFLGNIGILLAALLLIVPGIFVAARWSMSSSIVVLERSDGSAALSESWNATRDSSISVFVAQVVFLLAVAGVIGAAVGLIYLFADYGSLVETVLTDVAITFMWVGNWIFGAAIYSLIRPNPIMSAEVFA